MMKKTLFLTGLLAAISPVNEAGAQPNFAWNICKSILFDSCKKDSQGNSIGTCGGGSDKGSFICKMETCKHSDGLKRFCIKGCHDITPEHYKNGVKALKSLVSNFYGLNKDDLVAEAYFSKFKSKSNLTVFIRTKTSGSTEDRRERYLAMASVKNLWDKEKFLISPIYLDNKATFVSYKNDDGSWEIKVLQNKS